MGEATNKAIMIGVGLFVTLMIVSGIMFIFSQMKEVYKQVGTTDTTIGNRFGEYASYNNTQVTGLDVINCANKYYNENLVVIMYINVEVNTQDGLTYLDNQYNNGFLLYEDLFNSIVEEVEYDGLIKTRITFTKI